ncbi:MAG: hypothetical protein H0T73_10390 [Ardenticatenales bacterium]|nr:hypothetical protein [Ardenticatenales bacterium]
MIKSRFRCDPTRAAIALKVPGHITWRWWSGGEHPTAEERVALAAFCGASEEELEAARKAIATIPPITLPGQSEEPKP